MFSPGIVVGKYRIQREIGRGGMGAVFLAEDTTLGRNVALKLLNRSITESGDFEERFRREARTLASLQHPHIVSIHSLERLDGMLAIDMPYFEQGSLVALLEGAAARQGFPLARVAELLSALACCHEAGIVHRDVKPSNILLSRDQRAHLSDFGLAKLLAEEHALHMSEATSSGFFLGTPSYAPPELWEGVEPAPTWDVYSVGLILYEALAGTKPYTAETPFALIKQVLAKPVEPLVALNPSVSPALNDAVMAMLERDPAQRPPTAGDALERLSAAPEMNDARPACPPTQARRRPKPKRAGSRGASGGWRRLAFVAAGVAIALAALAGLYAMQTTPRPVPGAEIGAAPLPDATQVRIFDGVDPSAPAVFPNELMLLPADENGYAKGVAWQGTHLWYFEKIAPQADELLIEGAWAEYADEAASLFLYGTLSGRARWTKPGEELAAALEFRNEYDGSRESRSVLFRLASKQITQRAYLETFDSAPFMQPLFFNDVVGRSLAWAASFEENLLARGTTIALVTPVPPDGSLTLDGSLDDWTWHISAGGGDGRSVALAGAPAEVPARLMLAHDGEGVYLGVLVDRPLAKPCVTISVLSAFAIPLANSPYWNMVFKENQCAGVTRTVNGKASPWEVRSLAASQALAQGFRMEAFVPFAQMDAKLPTQGTRWRIHCAVLDGDAPLGEPVVQWGGPDSNQARQGLIATFE